VGGADGAGPSVNRIRLGTGAMGTRVCDAAGKGGDLSSVAPRGVQQPAVGMETAGERGGLGTSTLDGVRVPSAVQDTLAGSVTTGGRCIVATTMATLSIARPAGSLRGSARHKSCFLLFAQSSEHRTLSMHSEVQTAIVSHLLSSGR